MADTDVIKRLWTCIGKSAGLFVIALVALHVSLFGSNLAGPPIAHHDEFLTLDRTLNVLATGDLCNVYTISGLFLLFFLFFSGLPLHGIEVDLEVVVGFLFLFGVFMFVGCLYTESV